MIYFAKSTGGFYSLEINGGNIPADAVEITDELHMDLINGQSEGKLIVANASGFPELQDPPALTTAELIKVYESALDDHLDGVAKNYKFKDRHSLALRAGYPNVYRALAIAFGEWMDGCNVQAYALLNEVLANTKPMPTVEGFIAGLPAFVAPE